MALMKCEECGGQVSSKADKCPHCGAPVNENTQTNEVKEISIYKEKCNILIIILLFIVSLLVGITFIFGANNSFYFIRTPLSKIPLYHLLNYSNYITYFILFISSITLLTFLSFVFKIKSRLGAIISSILNILTTIIYIVTFVTITSNRGIVGKQFFLLLILNTILAIIPRIDKISIEKRIITSDKIEKINKKNNKIEQKHNNKKMKLIVLILSLISFLTGIVTTITIYNINENIEVTYEQKNPKKLDQIKVDIDFINVRKTPSTNSKILGKIYKNDIYNIIEIYEKEEYIWYEIEFEDEKAFVASSIKNPYVKIINNSNNKLKTKLLKEGYEESEDGIYQFIHTKEDGGIVLEYNFNENTYSSFVSIEEGKGQRLIRYYIDDKKVLYVLNVDDSFSTIEYNEKSKKTSCESNIKLWCKSYEQEYTNDTIIPFIEEYNDLVK